MKKETIILVAAVVISFIVGILSNKTYSRFKKPRIKVKNVDWDTDVITYTVNGGKDQVLDPHTIIGHGNIDGVFGLNSKVTNLIGGATEGFILSVIDDNKRTSFVYINTKDKTISYR